MTANPTVRPKPFTWSYSALKNYETCGVRYEHYNVLKDVREPETPQLKAGHSLHAAFDARLKGAPLASPYTQHEPMLASIANAPGETVAELKMALTSQFMPTAYFNKDVWFRTVVDAANYHGDIANIFDWKTGAVRPDDTQLKLMAVTTLAYRPTIHRVKASLVFLADKKIITEHYLREDMQTIWGEILPRVRALKEAVEANEFTVTPSGLCKKYCAVTSCRFNGGFRG